MGIKAHYLQDKDKNKFYPYSHADASYDRNGVKVGKRLDDIDTALKNKVEKIDGKQLSTNDLTNELKARYDKAEENVQSDWQETNSSSDAYIANKPSSLPANGGNADTVNGHTVSTDVPSGAKFTDTVYKHPTYVAKASGLYKITVDATGHVSNVVAVSKSDITALGIPASNTDTHYTSKNVVGASTATSNTNSALANGNVYLNSVENGAVTSSHKISGSGATTVTTDENGNIIISSTDNNTTYSAATVNSAGLMSSNDKTKLNGIETGANNYTLPTASSTLGGVKTTSTVTSTSGLTACPIISGVPYYKDTNTTYTLNSFGITATATELNHCDGVTSNIQTQLDDKATLNHTHNYAGSTSVGGSATSAVKLTTTSAGSATQPVYFTNGKPSACTYTLGKSVPSNAVFTDTNTWIALKGSTASTDGAAGYVPAPSAGASNRYLRCDGTWAVPPNTIYTHPDKHPASMITQDATHRFVSDTEKTAWNAKLEAGGNGSNLTATFTSASSRANIGTGEKLSTIFGKVAKWFSDLKSHAFLDLIQNATSTATDRAVSAAVAKNLQDQITAQNTNTELINYDAVTATISVAPNKLTSVCNKWLEKGTYVITSNIHTTLTKQALLEGHIFIDGTESPRGNCYLNLPSGQQQLAHTYVITIDQTSSNVVLQTRQNTGDTVEITGWLQITRIHG